MEKETKRTKQANPIASIIDNVDIPIPNRPRKPSSYDKLKIVDPEHRLVVDYDVAWKKYEEYQEILMKSRAKPKEEKIPVKKLTEVDIQDVYRLFQIKYLEVNGEYFNPKVNNGEAKQLVFTLIYYFFKKPNFFKSPLLNTFFNETNFKKGLMVFGGYGCGKTSIFKAFHKLFFDARNEPYIMVKDIDADEVHLKRYKIYFIYQTANDVVEDYELIDSRKKEFQLAHFWQNLKAPDIYFDDLMTERQANNFGKVEIFKEVFEKRDSNKLRTFCSLNYIEIIDSTGAKRFGNIKETLLQYKAKYGPRNYDRVFSNYNIIELKGKSQRK